MNLAKTNPNYDPVQVRAERRTKLGRNIVVGLAGTAMAGLVILGLKHQGEVNSQQLPIPTGEHTLYFEAGKDDKGTAHLTQHWRSKDGEGRFDQLQDVFTREAIAHDGNATIIPGEVFAVDGEMFEENPDNPTVFVGTPPEIPQGPEA